MSLGQEFSDNIVKLNQCKRNYSIIWWTYFIIASTGILFSVIGSIAAWGPDTIALPIDALIMCPLIWLFGRGGASRQSTPSAISGACLVISNAILMYIGSFLVTGTIFAGMGGVDIKYNPLRTAARWYTAASFFAVAAMILNIKTNRIYHFLEKQVGFPYFNLRYEEQKLDKVQRSIKDDFEQYKERLKKTESREMAEVVLPVADIEAHQERSDGRMDEV